jgi:hypothetical protein
MLIVFFMSFLISNYQQNFYGLSIIYIDYLVKFLADIIFKLNLYFFTMIWDTLVNQIILKILIYVLIAYFV